jgi:hypothetical protein
MPVDRNNLANVFTYHPPTGDQPARYANVRKAAMALAEAILDNVPQCGDQQAAIRHVREAMMTANAGIATEGIV